MANPFVHIELQTGDVAKAKEFYSKLFDWKLEDIPMPGGGGNYTMINVGDGTGGGMMTSQSPGVPPHWLAYVSVDDVAASTEKAKSLGAKVVQDVMQVGTHGWMRGSLWILRALNLPYGKVNRTPLKELPSYTALR